MQFFCPPAIPITPEDNNPIMSLRDIFKDLPSKAIDLRLPFSKYVYDCDNVKLSLALCLISFAQKNI